MNKVTPPPTWSLLRKPRKIQGYQHRRSPLCNEEKNKEHEKPVKHDEHKFYLPVDPNYDKADIAA
jgi:hypothetical protein